MSLVEIGVGTGAGELDLMPFTTVPNNANRVQVALPSQAEGAMVYMTVRGTNPLGMTSTASSNGVRMLCNPDIQTTTCVFDGYFLCVNMVE